MDAVAPVRGAGAPTVVRRAVPADAAAIARVRVDAWRSTYRGMIPDAYLDGMSVEAGEAQWRRILDAPPGRFSVFVAAEGSEVVGFASGLMLEPPKLGCDAELTAIYVRADRKRTGIGRRLTGTLPGSSGHHRRSRVAATGLLASQGQCGGFFLVQVGRGPDATPASRSPVHPDVVAHGARRSRRINVPVAAWLDRSRRHTVSRREAG